MRAARGSVRHSFRTGIALVAIMATAIASAGLSARAVEGHGPPLRAAAGEDCDRGPVALAWRTGGPQVKAAAEQALVGSDADVCAFIDTVWDQRSADDRRDTVKQMAVSGGPAVRSAAQTALGSSDPAAVQTFLRTGWRAPLLTDERIHVNQMMAVGGTQLRKAGQAALDSTDSGALQVFVDSGWRSPYKTDQRLRVNQILTTGGPEVKIAAQRALDSGDVTLYTRFIEIEWPVAAARDAESAQIGDLVKTATEAATVAEIQMQEAVLEADQAKAAAAGAKEAAAEAAAAALSAHNNAAAAAAAAKRAADAANNAAAAAREATQAAKAAAAAARTAASAAARAASAAAKTSKAAGDAYHHAASASSNADWAAGTRQAAEYSRAMAAQAASAATQADRAGRAALSAAASVNAALAAGEDAKRAAQSAIDAHGYATQAGAEAEKTRNAALAARRHAERSIRAAQAAQRYAQESATAAFQARDAANRAANDAIAAADAADYAIQYAADAAGAANRATNAANAATIAAIACVQATEQAQAIYTAARAAEDEQRAIAFERDDQDALDLAVSVQQQAAAARWDAQQAAQRDAETNRLLAEARNPATPHDLAVADGRKVALALAGSSGGWTSQAATDALGADDAVVLDFVRNGLAIAEGQDDRAKLYALMITASDALLAAATTAMAGSDADVAAFLATQDYPGRIVDDRIAVNQVLAVARTEGNTVVAQQAQAALDAGTSQALRVFLDTGQSAARATDQRVKVNQILASPGTGPETRNAAQVALDGPPQMLDTFLHVKQYETAKLDAESAAHNGAMLALLQQASSAASAATEHALRAEAAAATARGAQQDAATYAAQAAQSAIAAGNSAAQAAQSANAANQSAQQAAASAAQAGTAAKAAQAAQQRAANSMAWAYASAQQAAHDASSAAASAQQAIASATAAGADAAAALAAADETRAIALKAIDDANQDWVNHLRALCYNGSFDVADCLLNVQREVDNPAQYAQVNADLCAVLYTNTDALNNCHAGALSPSFVEDQAYTIAIAYLVESAKVHDIVNYVAMFGDLALLLAALPKLLAKLASKLPAVGRTTVELGRVAARQFGAELERAAIRLGAQDSLLAELGRALSGVCRSSFLPGTPVLLSDGMTKPIQDVRVGERVLATDPATGVTRAEPVTALITSTGRKRLVDVTAGGGTLTATANHPFWAPQTGAWVPAGNLRSGQWLRTSSGTWTQATGVRTRTAPAAVHNLTVAELHTYYVVAGGTPLLVHNASCSIDDLTDVAFGLKNYGLEKFAADRNFTQFMGNVPGQLGMTWRQAVLTSIDRASINLRVLQAGFEGTSPFDKFYRAVRNNFIYRTGPNGVPQKPFWTEMEMRWIAQKMYYSGRSTTNARTWESITFYDANYAAISKEAFPEPDWWNLFKNDTGESAAKLRTMWQCNLDPTRYVTENPGKVCPK
jgi:hypothetical protein